MAHRFGLTDLDKLVAIYILKRERDMVDGEVEIGLEEPFAGVRRFQPTRFMDDAMEAAKAMGLFETHALHYGKGAFTQDYHWYVSRIDDRGVLQGFVSAKVDSMAVTLACLTKAGVDISEGLLKLAEEVNF
jgi:hypothetical protein